MRLERDSLNTRLRALADSEWEDCVPLRWAAQFALGAIPGLLVVVAILHLAESTTTQHRKHGVSAASMIPLLSASALADNPAFHRLAQARSLAMTEAQFRVPNANGTSHRPKRVLNVTKRSSPLPVNFSAPRQQWQVLDVETRREIDAATPTPQKWSGVVLHGSGTVRGSATLLDRYQAQVKGRTDGAGYHFVIGNGQGAPDGRIQVTEKWKQAAAGHEASRISVCLVGDFLQRPPTQMQLQALDELMDYLGMKLGVVPVSAHEAGGKGNERCLGPKFPLEQIIQAVGAPASSQSEDNVTL